VQVGGDADGEWARKRGDQQSPNQRPDDLPGGLGVGGEPRRSGELTGSPRDGGQQRRPSGPVRGSGDGVQPDAVLGRLRIERLPELQLEDDPADPRALATVGL
jgi:hypothetical protein